MHAARGISEGMARPLRVVFEDAVYHVSARANERRRIFYGDGDRVLFLETLGQCAGLYGLKVHAYCLMPNHYHLIVETPRANLSAALGWLQTTFTVRFNQRRARRGHLFQGRFKAHLVDADEYAMTLLRYVHLNPVRPPAKGVAVRPERWREFSAYPWSSHRAYAGAAPAPGWLTRDWLLRFGRHRRAAQNEYVRFVRAAFGKPVEPPWDALRGGLVLGGAAFWERAKRLMAGKSGREELRWSERQERLERRVPAAQALAREEPDPRLRVWLRVHLGGERRITVARSCGYADGSAVTQLLKRLDHAAGKRGPLRQKMDRYTRELASRIKR